MFLGFAVLGILTNLKIVNGEEHENRCPYVNFYRNAFNIYVHRSYCTSEEDVNVFEKFGYKDINIPPSLSYLNPVILHESSVIRYVDDEGGFKFLDNGTFADVYLGELKDSGKPVVIKQFKGKTEFYDVDREARILMYLEDTGIFPKFYGYLPTGPNVSDISLVMEYIVNTESLSTSSKYSNLTTLQWFIIFEQITRSLDTIHSRFVLHNDLHRSNVLIVWNGTNPRIRLIDTGFSSFREGTFQEMYSHSLIKYPFFPRDSIYFESNPSMDIFALGYILGKVNSDVQNEDIEILRKHCYQQIPEHRSTADQLLYLINKFIQKYSFQSNYGYKPPMNDVQIPLQMFPVYETVPLPLLLLDELSPMPDITKSDEWLRVQENYGSFLGEYQSQSVVVRLFAGKSFSSLRYLSCVAKFASSAGIAPHFYGLIFYGSTLIDTGFVQEYVKNSTTLSEVLRKEAVHWTDKYRLKIACKIIDIIEILHSEHILLNAFQTSNFLYVKNGTDVRILFTNFENCSDANGIVIEEVTNYTAPEITAGEDVCTTFYSDVYSLGVVLQSVFRYSNSTGIKDLIQKCLYENPFSRLTLPQIKRTMCSKMNDKCQGNP